MMKLNTSTSTLLSDPLKNNRPKRPSRPLSAYNLFIQVERRRIVDGTDHLPLEITPGQVRDIINEHKSKSKRIHRKTHGKITFQELNATISKRWKTLNNRARAVLQGQARIEKAGHIRRVQQWEKKCAIQRQQQVPQSLNSAAEMKLYQFGQTVSNSDSDNNAYVLEQHRSRIDELVRSSQEQSCEETNELGCYSMFQEASQRGHDLLEVIPPNEMDLLFANL
mmetsp:Transcript_16357/g.21405  ORF Transcript_16357/g.21405 Transcript_16357/m.21405 type:complete len:223 (+) Transcript_16357:321-989(+)